MAVKIPNNIEFAGDYVKIYSLNQRYLNDFIQEFDNLIKQ